MPFDCGGRQVNYLSPHLDPRPPRGTKGRVEVRGWGVGGHFPSPSVLMIPALRSGADDMTAGASRLQIIINLDLFICPVLYAVAGQIFRGQSIHPVGIPFHAWGGQVVVVRGRPGPRRGAAWRGTCVVSNQGGAGLQRCFSRTHHSTNDWLCVAAEHRLEGRQLKCALTACGQCRAVLTRQ